MKELSSYLNKNRRNGGRDEEEEVEKEKEGRKERKGGEDQKEVFGVGNTRSTKGRPAFLKDGNTKRVSEYIREIDRQTDKDRQEK